MATNQTRNVEPEAQLETLFTNAVSVAKDPLSLSLAFVAYFYAPIIVAGIAQAVGVSGALTPGMLIMPWIVVPMIGLAYVEMKVISNL